MDKQSNSPNQDQDQDSFNPRGTLFFVLMMALGYAIYWGYIWFVVVIQRGGA